MSDIASPRLAAPTMGLLADGWHLYPLRVYYEDTDAGGIVYHASYLRFAERARSEFLRALGWPHERIQREAGLGWVVRRLSVDYRRSARLDEALTVASRPLNLSGSRLYVHQAVRRQPGDGQPDNGQPDNGPAKDGRDLVTLDLELVLLTADGRPSRIPASLADAFRPFLPAD